MNEAAFPKHTLSSLLGLAWPIIISRSTQVVVGLSDALMVAHLGESVLAAVTAGAMNSFAAFIFPMGIVFIVSSFSAQLAGRGDRASARRYGWYGLGVAVFAQILALVMIPFLPWILGFLKYEADVSAGLQAYLAIRLLSTGTGVGIEALGNYYGGLGNTSILMRANVAAMVLNVGLNWCLIDGHLGFPGLGLEGAAWASVFSTSLAFGGFFLVFILQGRGLAAPRLSVAEFLRMLRFGIPSGLNWAFEFFAFITFINIVVAGLGTSSLAAMMAVFQLNSFSFMPAFGLGSAGAILVGQAIGAGRKDMVPALVWLTFKTSAAWMGLVGILYWALPGLLLSPFARGQDGNPAFMKAGIVILTLSAFWQVLDAAGITVSESLRAAGDTAYAMWARGIIAWLFFLPASWIHVRVYGGAEFEAAMWMLAYTAILAAVLTLRFRGGAWRKIELVEPELPV